jgi:hypothetical protein
MSTNGKSADQRGVRVEGFGHCVSGGSAIIPRQLVCAHVTNAGGGVVSLRVFTWQAAISAAEPATWWKSR